MLKGDMEGDTTIEDNYILELSRERPMFNPQLTRGLGINPVFNFVAKSNKLVCVPSNVLKQTFPPARILSEKVHEVSMMHDACGLLIVKYKDESVTYRSAFSVAPGIFCTAHHNTLPNEKHSPAIEYYFSVCVSIPPKLQEAISEDQAEAYSVFQLQLLDRKVDYPNLDPYFDCDPKSKIHREDFADFVFMKLRAVQLPLDIPHLIPAPFSVEIGHNVVVIGFSSAVPSQVHKFMFLGMKETPPQLAIQQHFYNFSHKLAAPTAILAPITERLLVHNASTMPAASGSVVYSLEKDYFVGVNVGSLAPAQLLTKEGETKVAKGENVEEKDFIHSPNYNLCVSVHHPFFVLEYVRHVVLEKVTDKVFIAKIAPYLNLHEDLIHAHYDKLDWN